MTVSLDMFISKPYRVGWPAICPDLSQSDRYRNSKLYRQKKVANFVKHICNERVPSDCTSSCATLNFNGYLYGKVN
jgi:hypothetical protein